MTRTPTALLLLLAAALAAPAQAPAPPKVAPRVVPDVLYTPASAVESAHADARAMAKAGRDTAHYRYLSAYHATSASELQTLWELSGFVANSLDVSESELVPPARVDAGGRLLRVDLHALGISPKAWDELGAKGSGPAPTPEPYFHQELEVASEKGTRRVEKVWPGGADKDGNYFPAGYRYWVEEPVKGKRTVLAQASWLDKRKTLELVALTGSEFPVLRADWFVAYAMQPPAYYVFLGGPKDEEDFEKLAGVDEAAARKRRGVQLRGAALFSEVAQRNRALEITPTQFYRGRGKYAESFDFFTSLKGQDVLANLLQRKRDAGELIWTLPNGLQGYGLVNGLGKAIEFADPRVAIDSRTYLHDKVVWSGWKCVYCHSLGLIPVADEVRLSGRETAGFLEPDPKKARQIQDLYFSEDFNRVVVEYQQGYGAAVKGLTGKDPAALTLAFQEAHYRYLDAPLSLEDVAVEAGYPLAAVRAVVEEAGRTGLDHSFVRLLRGRKARRDQFEAAFGQLQSLLVLVPEKGVAK